ncbi:hypothetical protein BTJ68_15298 [Hortaea werneckii EXF-2000]|uniref:DUF6314 domain-containing protein n=1 Tax=Hortaea werneckii EXF-2000 TaxID=1157616 RepID=A0A1Z5SLT4_HORWE|nr:hypothetical protein BTJ68_15298 [Hortaea werneckii EXF-2000]
MKSVCIIGAGPAGLVAAKTFLQSGQFAVSVYEKKDRLGGIWAIDENIANGYLGPQTPTNLSRFTVAFSDLDWRSIDLHSKHDGRAAKLPMFPKAWHVNRYLQMYQQRFVPESVLHFNTEVIKAERAKQSADGSNPSWRITSKTGSQIETKSYDYLLVSSGFFSRPRPLAQSVHRATPDPGVQIIHSSEFKTLTDIFPTASQKHGKNILLIGGANSGGEAAAAVAAQLSNARWSPDSSERHEGYKVVHVVPRPLYALPPFVEYEKGAYVPIDFKLYDYSRRPPGPIQSNAGKQPLEVRNMVHGFLQDVVGGDQKDLGSDALQAPSGENKASAYVALSESYSEYVRSGLIEVVSGRVESIDCDDTGTFARTRHGNDLSTLKKIGAVVYATGYTPSAALDFLADDVKHALSYDTSSMRMPLILEQWQTSNREVPDIGFLGFYEGPYWGIMEMQSRVICQRWLGREPASQRPYEERDKLLELRAAMQAKGEDVPQFWFGDYLGYMEGMADSLALQRNDQDFKEREGCPTPARFVSGGDDDANSSTVKDLHSFWRYCIENGRFVSRAAFRALQGSWGISRRISSQDANFSGTLDGQADFHPRLPTAEEFDFEYLYIETGTFTSSTGLQMQASRRYVYRYSESKDQLSVWFVKSNADLEVDYLFHDLHFAPPGRNPTTRGLRCQSTPSMCSGHVLDKIYVASERGLATSLRS